MSDEEKKAIDQSNAVDAMLKELRKSDPVEFERVRRLPYREQLGLLEPA